MDLFSGAALLKDEGLRSTSAKATSDTFARSAKVVFVGQRWNLQFVFTIAGSRAGS
jgi:hypothetical protein